MPTSPNWTDDSTFVEQTNSPEWEWTTKATCVRKFKGAWMECWISRLYPGTFGTGIFAGMMVKKCNLSRDKGGQGILTIYFEGPDVFQPLPPTQVRIENKLASYPIEKHPKYLPFFSTSEENGLAVESVLRGQKTYSWQGKDTTNAWVTNVTDPDFVPEVLEVLLKRSHGEHVYHTVAPTVEVVTFSISPPSLTAGGFTELPPMSAFEVPGTDINNYTLPGDVSWIRDGDRCQWNGTHYELTMSWRGQPNADPDLFPSSSSVPPA